MEGVADGQDPIDAQSVEEDARVLGREKARIRGGAGEGQAAGPELGVVGIVDRAPLAVERVGLVEDTVVGLVGIKL